MITEESGMACISLADELAQRGLVVTALPNTVISELMRCSNISIKLANSVCTPEMFAHELKHATSFGETNTPQPSQHDMSLDGFVNDLVVPITRHISFAKNVVKPVITDYSEMVKSALEAQGSGLPSEAFTIEQLSIAKPLLDSSFTSLFDAYKDRTPLAPQVVDLKLDHNPDILTLMLTGDKETDKDITEWFQTKGPSFFDLVVFNLVSSNQGYSRGADSSTPDISYSNIQGMNIYMKADVSLALFLIATKLFNNTDMSSGSNMTLSSFKRTVAEMRDYAGALLSSVLEQVTRQAKTKMLVLDLDEKTKTIRVHSDTYKTWLEQNGSPETLFGLLVSGKAFYSQNLIDANTKTLQDAWSSYCLFENSTMGNRLFSNFKNILRFKFKELMNSLSEEEKEYIKDHADYYSKVDACLEALISDLRIPDMKNIDSVALKIICRTRFHYTDAESILSDIEEAGKNNPQIRDVREAALVAAFNYITDYVADQLSVTGNR